MAMRGRGYAAVLAALIGLVLWAGTAAAHHGWRWTEDGNFEVTGVVTSIRLGNPHGVLMVDVEGEMWEVEIGSPSLNARAGLEDSMFVEGMVIVISGHRSADANERRVKAERVYINGMEYNIYPSRD